MRSVLFVDPPAFCTTLEGLVRTWNVDDVTVPLPFNIGGSDFSTKPLWQSSDSLDGRYFGFLPASSVIGRAVPVWTWE
jgi:hypothetical protein